MNLFSTKKNKINPQKLSQVKAWVYEFFGLSTDIPISISQLQCNESGCPEIETAIAIMGNPTQLIKVHKAVNEIEADDIAQLFRKTSTH